MKELKEIYFNSLCQKNAIQDWVAEGNILIEENEAGIILANGDDESLGDHAHWTIWLPQKFPDNLQIEWEFFPLREPGLCMTFFSALGRRGESIFDESLAKRTGYYPQYHSGDINAYHISYFRHKYESERQFRTCNLRKSYGFHFAHQGADPLPPTEDAREFFRMKIVKDGNQISFSINDLDIFCWTDDGETFGPVLKEGYIGFRQMAPMKAQYRNLKISQILS
ncbi:DUF1961 domain-containing protein [Lachnospiraceae bacterium oral taxon 500]|nr:DUF1961 domain-containing protein [Lachnospiraceae bacterium oral taxon 500]